MQYNLHMDNKNIWPISKVTVWPDFLKNPSIFYLVTKKYAQV